MFKGSRYITGATEEELYTALGLAYIEPELREARGEIIAAQKGALPDLIGYGDLKGDLQVQTNWTDGANSIEEMAEEARRQGLEYICITDHTRSLAMTGGADEKKLEKQMNEIDKLNAKRPEAEQARYGASLLHFLPKVLVFWVSTGSIPVYQLTFQFVFR